MQNSLSVDERLEAQFSSWDIAPAAEIPELLFALRTHGTTITPPKITSCVFLSHWTETESEFCMVFIRKKHEVTLPQLPIH